MGVHSYQPPPQSPLAAARGVLTLVAVTHGAEVDVVLVVGEEKEAESGVEGVDGHNEEDADDVALLIGAAVAAQVHVDLGAEGAGQPEPRRPRPTRSMGGGAHPGPALPSTSTGTTALTQP